MRRKEDTLERMAAILEADNGEITEECKKAAVRDFSAVVKEYFDAVGEIRLDISRRDQDTVVTFSFVCKRVKNFMSLK